MLERSNWRAVFAAFFVGVVGAVQVGRVAPVASFLQQDFGIELVTLGWLISLITLASAALGLIAGVWVTRKGLRSSLIAGAIILGIATLVSAIAFSTPMLLAARILEGFGYLLIVVAAPTLIAMNATAKDMPIALAIWGTFFTLGLSVAAIGGGALSELWGWREWYFANVGLTVLAICVAVYGITRGSSQNISDRVATSPTAKLPIASWLLGAAFLGLTLLSLALLSMLPSFLMQEKGLTAASAGGITGLVALASIVGSLTYGVVAHRISDESLMAFSALMLICFAFAAFRPDASIAQIILFSATAVFVSGVLVAQTFTAVPRMVGDAANIGPSNGLVAQLGSVGALAGPPLVGFLVSTQGWSALPFIIGFFTLTFAVLFFFALASNRQTANA